MAPVTGRAIVATAERYIGRWTYVFGGAPNPPGKLVGDCSSFVSMVLGYGLRLDLPGGKWGQPGFPPSTHGPVVSDYLAWDGARTVPGPPQPGDLVIYGPDVHIGIAVSGTRFVSALNPSLGVLVEPIAGAAPGVLTYRRVTGTSTAANALGSMTQGKVKPAAQMSGGDLVFIAVAVGGVAALLLAGSAAVTFGLPAVTAWLLTRAKAAVS